MTILFASPYGISASAFYFDKAFYFNSTEEYNQKPAKAVNTNGSPIAEFEIQRIDRGSIDCNQTSHFMIGRMPHPAE